MKKSKSKAGTAGTAVTEQEQVLPRGTPGQIVKGTWSKPNNAAVTTYTDSAGSPFELTPGQTWIELPPSGAATGPTTPSGTAPATGGATGGTMATPGPLALPCQNDSACGFAKCNVQFQKCAFPCQSAVDCAAGASCNTTTGLCLPGAAPQ